VRAALAAFLVVAAPAAAFDVEVDADAAFQAYTIRAPGAPAFYARRRLLTRLALRGVQWLADRPDAAGRRARLVLAGRLRLEQDFGQTCLLDRDLCLAATDPDDPTTFQPLAADTRLDVPTLWAEVSGLPGEVRGRLGRQLLLDELGFARFDGVRVGARPLPLVEVDVYGGRLVRGTTIGGTPRSSPQGTIRLENALRIDFAAPPTETFVVGAALHGGLGRELRLRAAYRAMWEEDGQVLNRLGLAASSAPVDALRLDAVGVWDFLTGEAIEARAAARVGGDRGHLRVAAERRVPRFDPGSIWAWFFVAPIGQLSVGGLVEVDPRLTLSGALRGRRAELGPGRGEDLDGGADVMARFAVAGFRVRVSAFGWTGSLGPLGGAQLLVERRLFQRFELTLRSGLWLFDDPVRQREGAVVNEALGGRVQIGPDTQAFAELQHAYADRTGHRFRLWLALRVEVWR
jgi:hypothetical protein